MKKLLILLPLALVVLFVGCKWIINGNVLVILDLDDKHLTSTTDFHMWEVSKDMSQTWKDHEE